MAAPLDCGNGVLYFRKGYSDASAFARDLSEYLTNHPNHHVVSIVGDHEGHHTEGYVVVVELIN